MQQQSFDRTADGIAWSVADRIGRIVLHRAERANAISLALSRALVQAIDEVLAAQPRVVLLAAAGHTFCAGGDIDEFLAAGDGLEALVDDILTPLHPALHRLACGPAPVVAAVNGAIGGAGVGLALCADFVLATPALKLRTGYAAIGLSPDLGTSFFLARRVGVVRATQWLMLSDPIDAQQCLASGAVDALYPQAELQERTESLLRRLAQGSPESLAGIKRLCDAVSCASLAAHLELEHRLLSRCARSANAREGIRAFRQRRAPRFA